MLRTSTRSRISLLTPISLSYSNQLTCARQLSNLIPTYRAAPLRPPDEDVTVLPSSIELFHFYRLTLAQCAKLSTGSKLLDLSHTFAKYLDEYADVVLLHYFTPDKTSSLAAEDVVIVLNTADYCHVTTLQLQEKIKSKVDPDVADRVDFERQQDAFLGVVSAAIRLLVRKVEIAAEPAWREMRNMPWSRLEAVGDQSGYVSVLLSAVKEVVGQILAVVGKDAYQRAFCDKVVEAMAAGFLASVVGCRPIGGVGAEQMLLDAYVLKKGFEELLTLRSEAGTAPPASYIKHVARTLTKLDTLLKTLQVRSSPAEGLVQAYLIHISDRSDTNFRKVLDLKGIRRQDQSSFVELFRAHMVAHDNLVDTNPFLNALQVPSGNISGIPGGGGGGGGIAGLGITSSGGGLPGASALVTPRFDPSGLGSAIMNAARDGVDRLQTQTPGSDAGSGVGEEGNLEGNLRTLGRLFRRDGSGIGIRGRFGREGG